MLVIKNIHGYSRKKKYITGRGFVDTMPSIFNSIKSNIGTPTLRNIASYVSTNKDLITKPVLGAIAQRLSKKKNRTLPEGSTKIGIHTQWGVLFQKVTLATQNFYRAPIFYDFTTCPIQYKFVKLPPFKAS